ncbi:MAG: DNA polymerase Y family protein [Rhodobacteraceae bacterium]|nr:DNA polymerase Y family protein [Paracoccaceae bacterium]
MALRRILSLWFPRLAAERALRQRRDALRLPFAVVGERGNRQVLTSLSPEAEAAGLRQDQPLRDATAMCPGLVTVPENRAADEVFLRSLCRWAGKFTPWVAPEPPDAMVLDLTGCAHLFGGEDGLLAQIEADCADLGLTPRAGLAETRGAAWALARFAGVSMASARNGDAIRQEARATRSRAAVRRDGGTAPQRHAGGMASAAPGHLRAALGPLPLAALRLPGDVVEGLGRLGLRRVDEVLALPRAGLTRRFGPVLLRRLDQALGLEPEPVNPAAAPPHFAVRLSFPDPIGLRDDVAAGMDRLLAPLCDKLRLAGMGCRRARLEAWRSDGGFSAIEVTLARAASDPDRLRALLVLKLDQIEAGFGIDRLRLVAVQVETMPSQQSRGAVLAAPGGRAQGDAAAAVLDLVGKLGARLGTEAVTRLHPADSHIPGKTATILAAAWSDPAPAPWPAARGPRPIVMMQPERVDMAGEGHTPAAAFRWRGRMLSLRVAIGPERLMPEWWLDDPDWRNGARDYWRVETEGGERLWLFYAHGADLSPGWFCHGVFA